MPFPQDSWLYRGKTAFSMCSGAGTAESARAVLQKVVMKHPPPNCELEMDIRTVALWDSCLLFISQLFLKGFILKGVFNIFYLPKKMYLFHFQPRRTHQLAINCFSTITAGAVRLQGDIILCPIFSLIF